MNKYYKFFFIVLTLLSLNFLSNAYAGMWGKGELKLSKSKMEVRYSCGEEGISDFLNDGWIISKEYTEEKICTWKSFPATKDCDMEKDKGCKITTPDKIGEEKVYLLEK